MLLTISHISQLQYIVDYEGVQAISLWNLSIQKMRMILYNCGVRFCPKRFIARCERKRVRKERNLCLRILQAEDACLAFARLDREDNHKREAKADGKTN